MYYEFLVNRVVNSILLDILAQVSSVSRHWLDLIHLDVEI